VKAEILAEIIYIDCSGRRSLINRFAAIATLLHLVHASLHENVCAISLDDTYLSNFSERSLNSVCRSIRSPGIIFACRSPNFVLLSSFG
jgi:hypothetical protein